MVYGTLAAVSADNLASHQIGGFKIGFGFGFRNCCFCMATAADIQSKFFDYQHKPRSKFDHNFHCAGIAIENLRQHCGTNTAVALLQFSFKSKAVAVLPRYCDTAVPLNYPNMFVTLKK